MKGNEDGRDDGRQRPGKCDWINYKWRQSPMGKPISERSTNNMV
jgi:hypothetical protein